MTTMKLGSTGQDVKDLQTTMNSIASSVKRPDFNVGTVDGQYGAKTAQGVANFQKAMGLTVDGIVGPQTWNAIQTVGTAILAGQPVNFPGGGTQPGTGASVAPGPSQAAGTIPSGAYGVNIPGLGNVSLKSVGFIAALGVGLLMMFGRGQEGRK